MKTCDSPHPSRPTRAWPLQQRSTLPPHPTVVALSARTRPTAAARTTRTPPLLRPLRPPRQPCRRRHMKDCIAIDRRVLHVVYVGRFVPPGRYHLSFNHVTATWAGLRCISGVLLQQRSANPLAHTHQRKALCLCNMWQGLQH